jgi:excisionase family DNA binding protein
MPRLKKKYTQPAEIVPIIASVSVAPVFLSVEHEAGNYLGVTEWTIRRLIKTKNLVAKKIGRRLIVKRADLDALWDNEPAFAGKEKAA